MQHTLSDAQLHQAALAHAAKNRVSYSEAISSVVTIANYSEGNFSEHSNGVGADDAKFHAAAMRYSAENHVSYSEAASCVASGFQGHEVTVHDPLRIAQVQHTDASLDAAAQAYARTHSVSYSEALDCVVNSGSVVAFSEAGSSSAVAALTSQTIEIFRAGVCIDNAGNTRTFTPADIQATASSYSAEKHEAPLTLGHPEDNKPAYGWVKSLQATPDGRLTMQAGQVEPAFAEMVKAGRYKKRSASFYPPTHPSNPVPGVWYLKHLAWLGATAPALKGLPDANFSMQEPGMVSFEL